MVSQKQEFKNGDYKKNVEVIEGDWIENISCEKAVEDLDFTT